MYSSLHFWRSHNFERISATKVSSSEPNTRSLLENLVETAAFILDKSSLKVFQTSLALIWSAGFCIFYKIVVLVLQNERTCCKVDKIQRITGIFACYLLQNGIWFPTGRSLHASPLNWHSKNHNTIDQRRVWRSLRNEVTNMKSTNGFTHTAWLNIQLKFIVVLECTTAANSRQGDNKEQWMAAAAADAAAVRRNRSL